MKTFGIIGGLGTLSGGDVFFKLLKSRTVLENQQEFHFLFEQHPFSQINSRLHNESDISSRKFYTYNVCKSFEEKKVNKILLPCFASHTFIEQLQIEVQTPVLNMMQALSQHINDTYPKDTKIGVVTSNFVKNSRLFNQYFSDYQLVFPESQEKIMEAIYSDQGIKQGYLDGLSVEYIYQACQELQQSGCMVIVPGVTELSLIVEQLWHRGIHIIDANQIYVDYAIASEFPVRIKEFKLGVLGGVGPAATVDFISKVIKHTPAQKDQDHIKMIVQQNPQIPDRTANLLYNEPDPTIAMFSTCKRLEAEGAQAIAIPCNTAHAFVGQIQPHISIPIVNMLNATIDHIVLQYGKDTQVGLLATSGTIQSRVYHDVAAEQDIEILIPDPTHQQYVMESIYGPQGVKAGFSKGKCLDNIHQAIKHLASAGADVIILGCTELPIMFTDSLTVVSDNQKTVLIDPTEILATKCVSIAFSS